MIDTNLSWHRASIAKPKNDLRRGLVFACREIEYESCSASRSRFALDTATVAFRDLSDEREAETHTALRTRLALGSVEGFEDSISL
jgi:hypothetical protein